MGCWDIAARQQNISLSTLLGGTRDRVATGISIGIQANAEALAKRARAAFDQGYRKIKVKIEPGADIEYVRAVRQELGPSVHMMADANSAYTLADADHLAKLDAFDLIMIEQPLSREDLLRHAALQKRLETPICLDESITSVDRAEDMIALEAGKIINIKPGRVGGFTVSKAIHDVCERNGIPVWCGGMLESGIGRAHNVALASLPNFSLPGDLSPSSRYWERDIVAPEWTMDESGMVHVPRDKPGIGVTVDMDFLDSLTVRREELQRRSATK
jgi:o-succinylbenzoate synthase